MGQQNDELECLKKTVCELKETERAALEREQALAEANVRAVLLLEEVQEKSTVIDVQRTELEELSRELELRVDERTRALAEAHQQLQEMVACLEAQRDRLEQIANTDPLTELYNHRHFQERFDSELARARRFHRPLSLLLLDVDRFKTVNDTFGHQVGDVLLQKLAVVLKRKFRKMDIIARYGGDEFAVILPETKSSAAAVVAEKVRRAIECGEVKIKVATGKERTISATVTIGISSYPEHTRERDGLILAADIAMYSGKHLSRNTVSIYAPVQYGDHVLDPHDLYEMVHDPGASALTTLAAAVDARDKGTSGHSERVTKYAVNTAKALGLTREDVDRLQVAGLLHDVGKLGIPEEVLLKRSSLTCGEMKLVREHAAIGKAILERVPQMDIVLPAVLHHHERWDGQGYPDGLVGEHIPMLARILAVADAYDAMTSDRPYRKALLPEEAARELHKNAGVQFDAEVVEAFLNAVRESAEKKAA